MEDESRAAVGPRSVSPTETATAAEDHGLMQQGKQQLQEDDGVVSGEPGPSPPTDTTVTATGGDEGSHSSGTTPTPTAIPTPTSTAPDPSTNNSKSHSSPADISTSPRGTSTAHFVAPSDYLRPLAATREREDHHRSEHRQGMEGEAGVKRPMHPLDREQREGLVSLNIYAVVHSSSMPIWEGNE